MAILWCGGEDIDFQNGQTPTVSTSAGRFRSGYSRCGVSASNSTAIAKSTLFPGGTIDTAWISAQIYNFGGGQTGIKTLGLGHSGSEKGIYIGSATASVFKICVATWDGTTRTELASESGISLGGGVLKKFDMHIVNFGISSTIDVYVDGVLVISFSGDSRITGITNFDSVFLSRSGSTIECSEIIVADEDTRAMSLVTCAPNAAGTLTQWTGLFSDVNETTINDATVMTTNTVTRDENINILPLPSGSFAVSAVMLAARAASTTGATATQVALGVKNGANTDLGSAQTPGIGFSEIQRLMNLDPTTSANWAVGDIAGLQINLRSS